MFSTKSIDEAGIKNGSEKPNDKLSIQQKVLKVQRIYQKYVFDYSVDYTNIHDDFTNIPFHYLGTCVEVNLR